jgi:enolase
MVKLDGTSNKGRLGANAILAVSMAVAKASASARGVPLYRELRDDRKFRLPVPMMNIINGGEHAGNALSIQEFMIEPVGADSCSEAVRMGAEVYQSLKGVLSDRYGRSAINVGDEGGFAPPLTKTRDALDAVVKALKMTGYAEGDVRLGIDAASSVFFDEKSSTYKLDGRTMDAAQLGDFYSGLLDEYALLTIEDPFSEEAFGEFAALTRSLGRRAKIIGDDIYVTNIKRIRRGIKAKASNGVLIKLNQIGTVSETEAAIELTKRVGWAVAVSHRSGETEDPFIAHLATAMGSEFIKTGAPARGERVAKYNELLRIEEELGSRATFAGKAFRK